MAMESMVRVGFGGAMAPAAARLRSELDLGQVWPSFLVWLAVSVCTLGLGWIVVSGHFFRLILNTTVLVDAEGRRLGRLQCDYDMDGRLGQVALWVAVSIATLGVGLLFYSFRAAQRAVEATTVEWIA